MITKRDINRLREMVRFELSKEIKKGVSRLVTNVRQRKNSELEFNSKCFLSHARDKTNYIFLYFFTELKTYHLSYSIYL